MKIRSLFLGSAAVAGLTTGAYAADLGVLTSLDMCDSLGLSGLTVSSDSDCLQVSGEVKYKFTWGDYKNNDDSGAFGVVDVEAPNGTKTYDYGNGYNDWESRFDAYIKFVATANTDFGPAKAVIKLKEVDDQKWWGGPDQSTTVSAGGTYTTVGAVTVTGSVSGGSGTATVDGTITATAASATTFTEAGGTSAVSGSDTDGVIMDEAYVSIGDSTVIMAGKKGSVYNDGDDEPLNWLGLFNSSKVDAGVGGSGYDDSVSIDDGGHVIQVTSDLGNGFSVSAGLENLNGDTYTTAGTAVGVLAYSGDGISAHASFEANGILAGEIQDWRVHTGFAGTFDNFKLVGAAYFDSSDYWNVLASASATFDMFTLAGSVEAASAEFSGQDDYWGAGASLSAKVTDTVTLNLGGRWAHETDGDDSFEVAAGVVAAVTDTLSLTGTVGYVDDGWQNVFYGTGEVDWAPGGGFTSSIKGTINSDSAYKIETTFDKTFQ